MGVAPEGKTILLTTALLAIVCVSAGITIVRGAAFGLAIVGIIPLAFSLWFFRDPDRSTPAESGLAVSPADGEVIETVKTGLQGVGNDSTSVFQRISIFMSPFDVHVNRIPVAGTIAEVKHYRGTFKAAFKSKASLENERQHVGIVTVSGPVHCVQIAGWLARRIVCHLQEGRQVTAGERFGMIKFGSRVDLYLPERSELKVKVGQKVRAGETIVATFPQGDPG